MIGITEISPPKDFVISQNPRDFRTWENVIKDNVNEEVDAIIILLEGRKNAAPLYK